MGTPALFFYSVLCFFSDDINKLYCVEWKKARKSTKFLYFRGQKRAMLQILLERYAYSEISGTSILI